VAQVTYAALFKTARTKVVAFMHERKHMAVDQNQQSETARPPAVDDSFAGEVEQAGVRGQTGS
jgi:hypothetical protein